MCGSWVSPAQVGLVAFSSWVLGRRMKSTPLQAVPAPRGPRDRGGAPEGTGHMLLSYRCDFTWYPQDRPVQPWPRVATQ